MMNPHVEFALKVIAVLVAVKLAKPSLPAAAADLLP